VFVVGFLGAAAKLIFLAKLGAFRRVLAFDAFLDMLVGSVFAWLFYGTLTGMVIAAIATIMFFRLRLEEDRRLRPPDAHQLRARPSAMALEPAVLCAWQDRLDHAHPRLSGDRRRSPLIGSVPCANCS
jgi:hypothetical protein